jgi:hypothetical protein
MGFVFENLCVAVWVLLLVGCGFVWVLFEVFLGCAVLLCDFLSIPPLYILNCMGFCGALVRVDPSTVFCMDWLLGAK